MLLVLVDESLDRVEMLTPTTLLLLDSYEVTSLLDGLRLVADPGEESGDRYSVDDL